MFLMLLIFISVTTYSVQTTAAIIQNERKILVGVSKQNLPLLDAGLTDSTTNTTTVYQLQPELLEQTNGGIVIINTNGIYTTLHPLEIYISLFIVLFLAISIFFTVDDRLDAKKLDYEKNLAVAYLNSL